MLQAQDSLLNHRVHDFLHQLPLGVGAVRRRVHTALREEGEKTKTSMRSARESVRFKYPLAVPLLLVP